MKAWVLEEKGKLRLKETEKPKPSGGEVLLRVMAAGLCGSDIQRIYETGAHHMPLISGHEFSGVVESVGDNVSADWIGTRAGVFPLIPCGKCPACREKKYEMCRRYSYLGSRADGGFAEYVKVPEWNLIELSEEVNFEQAALLEPMAVAVHAMRRTEIAQDAVVAVAGLGSIGQFLIMFLLERGIRNILAVGNSDAQKSSVLSLGLTERQYCGINAADAVQFLLENTAGRGVGVFFDCAGKNETVEMAFDSTASGGQICIVGNPCSDMRFDKETWWKLLRRQLRISGTWNSTYYGREDEDASADDWNYVLDRIRDGRIHPEQMISHRLSMEELEKGLLIMRDKTEPYTKIMISQPDNRRRIQMRTVQR